MGEESKNSTLKRPDLVSVTGHNLKLARKPPAQTLTQLSKIARGEKERESHALGDLAEERKRKKKTGKESKVFFLLNK